MYSFTVNNDGTVTFDSANGIIYNRRVMSEEGANKIRKYKTGTTEPVEGAVIGLFDENGNALRDREGNRIRKTTDEKGEIEIPALEVGTYKYQELEAPEGYIKDDTMYGFTVNNYGTITFDSANGIIYNEKLEESKPPVTDDNKEPPKTDNTNKKPTPEERPAIIPQTGKSSIIIKLMGVTVSFTVYYGFKLYRQRKESNF